MSSVELKIRVKNELTIEKQMGSSLLIPYAGAKAEPDTKADLSAGAWFRAVESLWLFINGLLDAATNRFIPAACVDSPELWRRARMVCRFGHTGAIFGAFYAGFYVLIGHRWGALVVLICSSGFEFTPYLMKRTGSVDRAGHLLCAILIAGFSTLCLIEGGMQGHAIAWLASVPLCALILVGRQAAGKWMLGSFVSCAVIAGIYVSGISLKPTYDAKWETIVSSAGYLGFILFMFLLGIIFETGRERAFGKMEEANNRLEVSNAQLKQLNDEKSEFLGIAAHDLKNPLSVVIGTAELLKMGQDPAMNQRLAGNIVGAGTRMLRLVKDLLDANAIEEGRFASNLERCNLRVIVRECIDNNSMNAANKNIKLQLENDVACWVKADRNASLQVLDNLISNALKYSPRDTTVHVRTGQEGEVGYIAIRDEGPGISEEDMKKMFGKFTRLTARPTGGESSNGLGLSIVKKLAESMSGTVRCESKLGEGSTFFLQLPKWKDGIEG